MEPKDITGRVLARPLRSPYGHGSGPRRMRWWWFAIFAWLVWVTVLSDHSLWRISRLHQELRGARAEVAHTRAEASQLQTQLRDPVGRLEHDEQALRRQGMARPGEIIYQLGGRDSTVR